MFTGLVQATGALVACTDVRDGRQLTIECGFAARDLELGASVAVGGVCLTVTAAGGGRASFEAAFETLRKTTLGQRSVGDRLNLEPSLRMGDALGGHLVSGHVDGVGSVRTRVDRGDAWEVWCDVPLELRRFIAPKGSVTIDGVSLTVNEVDDRGFMVGIIPHTLSVTTLGSLTVGDPINLEVDVLARYVARLLEFGRPDSTPRGGVTRALLQEAGFAAEDDT